MGPGAVVSDKRPTICDIGNDCTFGVQVRNSPSATAIASDLPTGRIEQAGTGGDIDLNDYERRLGDVHAIAFNSILGNATALASAFLAVGQQATGTGNVALDFENRGSLQITAIAKASGADVTGGVFTSTFSNGVSQATTVSHLPGVRAVIVGGLTEVAHATGGGASMTPEQRRDHN